MALSELFAKARREVDAAELPADLRPVAFGKALDILAAEKLTPSHPSREPPGGPTQTSSDNLLEAVAAHLRIPEELVAEVYYEHEGELGIAVGAARLDRTDARATKELALLIASARQAAQQDDSWTSFDVIREVSRDFGRLDAGNFAATVTSMTDVFTFRGRGQGRMVRVTRPGFERAAELVRRLAAANE